MAFLNSCFELWQLYVKIKPFLLELLSSWGLRQQSGSYSFSPDHELNSAASLPLLRPARPDSPLACLLWCLFSLPLTLLWDQCWLYLRLCFSASQNYCYLKSCYGLITLSIHSASLHIYIHIDMCAWCNVWLELLLKYYHKEWNKRISAGIYHENCEHLAGGCHWSHCNLWIYY